MPETAEEKAAREAAESRGRSGPTDEGRGVARKLLNKFRGRAEEALASLADENRELRDDRRTLRVEVEKFKAPGTVVLSADDAKAWEAFKGLGQKPEDLKKALDEVPTLRAKVLENDRRTVADEAAPLLGYNAAALREVVTDKRLEITFKDALVEGKTVKVPHVKPIDDAKAVPVPFAEYAKTSLSAYLPALTAKAGTGTPAAQNGATKGTQMVEQSAGSGTAQNGDGTKPRQPATSGNYMTPGQRAAKQNATT